MLNILSSLTVCILRTLLRTYTFEAAMLTLLPPNAYVLYRFWTVAVMMVPAEQLVGFSTLQPC